MFQLYWFTVEFGVCQEDGETKVYGADLQQSLFLCSSYTGSQWSSGYVRRTGRLRCTVLE